MKIIITQCTDLDNWYKDMIGQEFELSHEFASYYWVKYTNDKGKPCMNTININDGKII